MIIRSCLLNTQSRPALRDSRSRFGAVAVEHPCDTDRDIVPIAPGRSGSTPTDAGVKGELADAPQLTETAPKILHSKGCFEAV